MLAIGIPTFADLDGVFFTLQALKIYHDLTDCELLVVDNDPDEEFSKYIIDICDDVGAHYLSFSETIGPAAAKNKIIEEAEKGYVLIIDGHSLLASGSIDRLKQFYRENPDFDGLIHGPIKAYKGEHYSTNLKDYWNMEMWGIGNFDLRGQNVNNPPFEILAGPMGCFATKKDTWLGFNKHMVGFGGEEMYIHFKYRKAGRKVLCHPGVRCIHRWQRMTVPYPLTQKNKVRNVLIGLQELGMPIDRVRQHFVDLIPEVTETGHVLRAALHPMSAQLFDTIASDPVAYPPELGENTRNKPCILATVK